MKNCIIVGKPNVGKTSFFISLAEYLGINQCEVEITDIYGNVLSKSICIDNAKKTLISMDPFKTRSIYRIQLSIPVYKGYEHLILTDTAGLTDGINDIEEIRRSMAQTLMELSRSNIILHILDAHSVGIKKEAGISQIDFQINEYGSQGGSYCILANKMDKYNSRKGLEILKENFKKSYIIPISTINKTGFKDVKNFVGRNL